jgi:hypothetical protein
MIASFFQNLKAHQVEYLLISGQAAVLHGAATFSEEIDVWIQPVPDNAESFLRALRAGSSKGRSGLLEANNPGTAHVAQRGETD